MACGAQSAPGIERRATGGLELAYCRWGSYGVGRFFWISALEGPVDAKLVRDALVVTVKKHPGLRSRIKKGLLFGGTFETLSFESCPEVELKEAESDDVFSFTEKHLQEIKHTDGSKLYNWSLTLHRTPAGKFHLVGVNHHSFSDGMSAVYWVGELVGLMGKMSGMSEDERREVLEDTKSLPQLPSADTQLGRFRKGIRYFNLLHTHLDKMKYVFGASFLPLLKGPGPRVTRFKTFALEGPQIKALHEACKAQKTTITGAIGAAAMRGLCELMDEAGEENYGLVAEVPVNLRQHSSLKSEGYDDTNLHQLHMIQAEILMKDKTIKSQEFWTTAQQFQGEVKEFTTKPAEHLACIDWNEDVSGPTTLPVIKLFDRTAPLLISALGVTDKYIKPAGPFRVTECYMGTEVLEFGHGIVMTVWTVADKLTILINFTEPIVSSESMQRLGDSIMSQLSAHSATAAANRA